MADHSSRARSVAEFGSLEVVNLSAVFGASAMLWIAAGFFAFSALAVVLLIWPSKFLRHAQNPWQPDTPVQRVYMRGMGLFLALLLIGMISGSTQTHEGFHRNILVALWVVPVFLPIFYWVLWRHSPLKKVERRHLVGEPADWRWERWMSATFCALIGLIVATAYLLSKIGMHPRW